MLKKISLFVMAIFYTGAGINHFRHPASYYPLIPPYLPNHFLINIISGILEISLGILLMMPVFRKAAAFGIIFLLIAFIPAHIYMITKGGCMGITFCIPSWLTWVRLFPLQFLLILWARWHVNK